MILGSIKSPIPSMDIICFIMASITSGRARRVVGGLNLNYCPKLRATVAGGRSGFGPRFSHLPAPAVDDGRDD